MTRLSKKSSQPASTLRIIDVFFQEITSIFLDDTRLCTLVKSTLGGGREGTYGYASCGVTWYFATGCDFIIVGRITLQT